MMSVAPIAAGTECGNWVSSRIATIGGFVTLAGGMGPVLLNMIYDATGSYTPALLAAIPVSLTAATLFLLLGPYPENPASGPSGH